MSSYWLVAEATGILAALAGMAYLFRQVRAQHGVQDSLAQRTATVNRLLDFSQTIQGAGKADQIFATLSHFLRSELGLSGIVVLSSETDVLPPIQMRAIWPEELGASSASAMAEMDPALCPCLRQNLPRLFKPEGAPVRCAVDGCFKLPVEQPAYCIPFNIGRKVQAVAHMLLPAGEIWTEERRQVAQTYVNTAHSALTSLYLLNEAEKQSMTDGLTGLFNRRSMDQLLQREVALAERYNHPMSLVMIDLDHFKEVNDTHGHAAGDHMLKAFADCVRITLRKTDLAFRYGGDEFVIALPQTPLFQAQQVVQKLRQAFLSVDFSHAITHLDKNPTLSIGVAERNKSANILSLANLLSAADQALYSAKNSTRNCIKIFEPPQAA
jgi:diguanylate cyclase (GGDEF)-like protein